MARGFNTSADALKATVDGQDRNDKGQPRAPDRPKSCGGGQLLGVPTRCCGVAK